jgi:threonyl-tRNA synthetase
MGGFRARLNERSERMNLKIREAQLEKVPYMVIIGDEEVKTTTVTVRLRSGENFRSQSLASFKAQVKSAIESKQRL